MQYVYPLTDRELEVLELAAAGWSNSEISIKLEISRQTVKNHLHAIYFKMGAENRSHAVIVATICGLLNPFAAALHAKPPLPLPLRSELPEPADPIDFGAIRAIWE